VIGAHCDEHTGQVWLVRLLESELTGMKPSVPEHITEAITYRMQATFF
jgi:hypothetical protein